MCLPCVAQAAHFLLILADNRRAIFVPHGVVIWVSVVSRVWGLEFIIVHALAVVPPFGGTFFTLGGASRFFGFLASYPRKVQLWQWRGCPVVEVVFGILQAGRV